VIETGIACIAISIAAYMLVNSTLGRVYGFHRPRGWSGGGEMTLAGELSISIFVGSVGFMFLAPSAIWVIPSISAWIVGYVSQNRANRKHRANEEELRRTNALKHPGVFDDPPPKDIGATEGKELDLYDAGACTYLGTVLKSDIQVLIDTFTDTPEQGPNDIFFILESLEMVPEGEISEELVTLLEDALEQREYLVLRWMPRPDAKRTP
jgi:hypothetical protein